MSKVFVMLVFLGSLCPFNAGGQERDNVGSGQAIEFDGVDDYINLGNVYDDLDFPFTISLWIKMDRSNFVGPLFVTQDNAPVYNGFWLVISQAGLTFEFGDGYGENSPAYRKGRILPISEMSDRWFHIAGVMRSESDMDLYFNGLHQPANESGGSPFTMQSTYPYDHAKIGTWTSNGLKQYFKGLIDEVRLYNRALSEDEIRETMCRQLNGNEAGLIGYWDFNETSGTVVKDRSPRGFDGTLFGDPTRVYSGAPIGNESFANYNSVLSEVSWNSVHVSEIQSGAYGVQIYKVNSLPSQTDGLDISKVSPPYYGVFIANFAQPKSFRLTQACMLIREDNSVPEWRGGISDGFVTRTELILNPSEVLEVDLGPDLMVCPGVYELGSNLESSGKEFMWGTGETSRAILVNHPGTYHVVVSSGCASGHDDINVLFIDQTSTANRFVQNIITPNDDGKNEYFVIEKFIADKPVGLDVFNRWGVRVFQDQNYKNTWDGNDLPDGVYYYRLQDECGNIIKGSVTITD